MLRGRERWLVGPLELGELKSPGKHGHTVCQYGVIYGHYMVYMTYVVHTNTSTCSEC